MCVCLLSKLVIKNNVSVLMMDPIFSADIKNILYSKQKTMTYGFNYFALCSYTTVRMVVCMSLDQKMAPSRSGMQ